MEKKKRRTYKLIFDAVILAFLALMYQKRAISMQFHELGGLGLCALFLVHKLLNRQWICRVTAGIFRGRTRLNSLWVTDLLLLLAMTGVLVTGLFISKTLPTALKNGFRLQTWHYFAAAVSLVLSGVHLGLHWPLIRTAVWNKLPLKGKVRPVVGIVLVCVMLGCGGRSLARSSVLSWLSRPFSVTVNAREFPGRGPGSGNAGRNAPGAEGMPEAWGDAMAAETDRPEGAGRETRMNTDAPMRNGAPGKGRSGMQQRGGSFSAALSTVGTYLSIALLVAVVTAGIRGLFLKRKRAGAGGPSAAD